MASDYIPIERFQRIIIFFGSAQGARQRPSVPSPVPKLRDAAFHPVLSLSEVTESLEINFQARIKRELKGVILFLTHPG